MKAYLGNKAIFAKNEEEKVYKVESIQTYDGYDWMHLDLVNVEDEEDTEHEICYFMEENIKECLEANGYTIVENPAGK